jgi:D-glycero-D-manno-heptose 1,7-bisphosphate phosphatase
MLHKPFIKEKYLTLKNILLDRDGTIIEDMHYLRDPEKIIPIPGAVKAMQEMNGSGLNIFVVTNQSGIGRGYLSENDYQRVQQRLISMLREDDIQISGSLFCPHIPGEQCRCRKPGPGMWEILSESFGLSPEESIIIGDKSSDIHFGRNCGLIASVLVLTGHGLEHLAKLGIRKESGEWFEPEQEDLHPSAIALDLYSAWLWIRQRFSNVF